MDRKKKIRKTAAGSEFMKLRGLAKTKKSGAGNPATANRILTNPVEAANLMLENANDAIYVLQGDFFQFANAKTVEISGYSLDEIIAKPFIDLVHSADRAAISDRYRRRLRGEDVSNLYPHRIVSKKGNVKWVEVNNVLISWQDKPAVLCFMRDITEKKEAEDALRQSERHLADIINFLPDATFAVDKKGTVIAWNRAIEALTGIASRNMIGKRNHEYTQALCGERMPMLIDKIIHPSVEIAQPYLAAAGEEDSLLAEMEVVRNGRHISFWCKASPIYDPQEKIIGAIESLRDITALKKTEGELKAKTRRLKEMNTALKVLLQQREDDSKEIEEKFLLNIKELVMPYIRKIKTGSLDATLAVYVDLVENHLNKIISPFLANLTSRYSQFTPREIQVISLIREGMTTKEIAGTLNISTHSVDIYRQNIRKKAGLKNKKISIRSFTASLVK
jgi:PAS domain S-box-containing protein